MKKKTDDSESYAAGDPNEEDSLSTVGNELFDDEDESLIADPEGPEEKKLDKGSFARSYMLHRAMLRKKA